MNVLKFLQTLIEIAIAIAFLVGCAVPTAKSTPFPPTSTPTSVPPTPDLIEPGEKVGNMVLTIGPEEGKGVTEIWDYCDPFVTEAVVVRQCKVPASQNLSLGYGFFARTLDDLNDNWRQVTWELYLDGQPVDLPAFGTFDRDGDIDGPVKMREWNVVLEQPSPGEYTLHYVVYVTDSPDKRNDMTWEFTIYTETTAIATPSITYPTLSSTPQKGQHPYTSQGQLNFLLYVPEDYGGEAIQEWPMILFLHGIGERGDNLGYVRGVGLPKILETKSDFPFIVVSPQLIGGPSRDYWSHPAVVELLFGLLEEIKTNLSVDPRRIYLTGISLGGAGSWEIGLQYPGHFAALVPVAGFYGIPAMVPENICDLKNMPIWAFHGAKDTVVPLADEERLIDALRVCGGNVQFTVYPDGGHEIWDQVYAAPDLYTWMLAQVK